jgi:hypothetical protein
VSRVGKSKGRPLRDVDPQEISLASTKQHAQVTMPTHYYESQTALIRDAIILHSSSAVARAINTSTITDTSWYRISKGMRSNEAEFTDVVTPQKTSMAPG